MGYIAQVELGQELPFWGHISILAGGALSAAVAIVLPLREQKKQEILTHEATQLATIEAAKVRSGLQDRVFVLSTQVAVILEEPDRTRREIKKGQLKRLAVDLLCNRIDKQNVRASFLTYSEGPAGRRLACVDNLWHGRDRPPRTIFSEGTDRGSYMLQLVDERAFVLVKDVDSPGARPPGWDMKGWNGERSYKTFTCATVALGDQVFGVLALDSPDPGGLTELDEQAVRLFALILAIGLAI
ncbi:hypothetical protein [Herbidospora sp. RD11066]